MGLRLTPVQERDTVDINFGQARTSNLANQIRVDSNKSAVKVARDAIELEEKARLKAEKDAKDTLKTRVKNNLANVMTEARNKVATTQGENAFVETEKAQLQMKTQIDEIVATVPEYMREETKAFADNEIRQFNVFASGYQIQEYKKVQNDTYKTRQENIVEQAVLSASNPEAFSAYLQEIDNNTAEYTRITKGGLTGEPSPEVKAFTEASQLKARSGAVLKAVESFVSIGDTDMANLYNTKFKETITATDQIKINKLLQEGAEKNEDNIAKMMFDRVLKESNNDRMVANRMARQMSGSDGKVYSKLNGMLNSYFNTYDEDERIRLDKQAGSAYKDILSGKFVNPQSFDGRIASKINEYNQKKMDGKLNVTDPKTYSKLFNQFLYDPSTFGDPEKTNLDSYFNKLSSEKMAELKSLQNSVRDPQTSKYTTSSVSRTIEMHVNRIAADRGINYRENPKAFTKIRASVESLANQALVNTAAKLGDRASAMDFERTFNNEMAFKLSKSPTMPRGLFNTIGAVVNPFDDTPALTAIDQYWSEDPVLPRPPEKDYLKDRQTEDTTLVDPKNPAHRKAADVLRDQRRRDVQAGKIKEFKEPTNEEILDLVNRARKNKNIRESKRR